MEMCSTIYLYFRNSTDANRNRFLFFAIQLKYQVLKLETFCWLDAYNNCSNYNISKRLRKNTMKTSDGKAEKMLRCHWIKSTVIRHRNPNQKGSWALSRQCVCVCWRVCDQVKVWVYQCECWRRVGQNLATWINMGLGQLIIGINWSKWSK